MIISKAQSALEYLMIIALTLGIVVPTTYILFNYSSESSMKVVDSQINQVGRSIIDTAETVYFSGEGAKIVLEVNMPKEVADIDIISRRELIFKTMPPIDTELVFFSPINVPIISDDATPSCTTNGNCDLSGITGVGLIKIKMESVEDGGATRVRISKA